VGKEKNQQNQTKRNFESTEPAFRINSKATGDDDDNGFGSTVRYASGVTKVHYRKKI